MMRELLQAAANSDGLMIGVGIGVLMVGPFSLMIGWYLGARRMALLQLKQIADAFGDDGSPPKRLEGPRP